MKKVIAMVLAIVMMMSFACTAFAAEMDTEATVEYVELNLDNISDDDGVMPIATLGLSFSNLGHDMCELSPEVYYVKSENSTLHVTSATWTSQASDVAIGWYKTDTHVVYYARFSGGSVYNKRISSKGLPDGNYRVVVMNIGSDQITGSMQYSVS